jgi:hypothetical protein
VRERRRRGQRARERQRRAVPARRRHDVLEQVLLQVEAAQLHQRLQPFDGVQAVALQEQRLGRGERPEVLDAREALEVQVELLVELGQLVAVVVLAGLQDGLERHGDAGGAPLAAGLGLRARRLRRLLRGRLEARLLLRADGLEGGRLAQIERHGLLLRASGSKR